jgi:PAS domain S-box-containing protein
MYSKKINDILSSIVESSQDAIVGEDLDGNVISWNKGAEKLYGYSAEEAVGQAISLRIPPNSVAEATMMTERRRRGESIDHYEVERVTKDGKQIHVSVAISPIRDSSGQHIGTSRIARDITTQNRAEEARRISELRYRRLFESAKDGILILDAESGQIVDVNPFLIEMLAYSKEELMGKELWEIGVFRDVVASKAAFIQLKEQGYIRYDNLPLETRDGHHRQVEFVSNTYMAGESRVIQCNIRDITESKLAEEVLKHLLAQLKTRTIDLAAMTQQLWQSSKLATMGELAASIAHELNNPLQIISLRIDSLAEELTNDARQSHALEIIANEVDRMGKLVGNLLRFSRYDQQEIASLDIREEIENSLELVEYHLRAHNIEVVRDFAETLPNIQADREKLLQVLLNLLTNASDAMPQGGTVTARVRSAESKSGVSGVSIDLIDTGPGIPPAVLAKIWEPFFTTKSEGKGTGLGLAISRRAIEGHHGTLSIESHMGEGTMVTIFLPLTNGWKEFAEES